MLVAQPETICRDVLPFEAAWGSIPGRDHVSRGTLLVGRNNQDACCYRHADDVSVAVVCDGCGSGTHSEVGAQLAARLLAESLLSQLKDAATAAGLRQQVPAIFEQSRRELLVQLRMLAQSLGGPLEIVLHDFFLFTVVAAVVTPEVTAIAAAGDGVFAVNGQVHPLGPFAGNAPPYLGYGLWPMTSRPAAPDPGLDLQLLVDTRDVDSLLIGSDGVLELIAADDRQIPGSTERAGPLSQFWQQDRYFRNPDALRRRLARINSAAIRFDELGPRVIHTPGLLPDDTTLVVLRRRPTAAGART